MLNKKIVLTLISLIFFSLFIYSFGENTSGQTISSDWELFLEKAGIGKNTEEIYFPALNPEQYENARTIAYFMGNYNDPVNLRAEYGGALYLNKRGNTSVYLYWADSDYEVENNFYVERSVDGTTWSSIATLGANIETYTNTGLEDNTTYYYRVKTDMSTGPYSNVVAITTRDRTGPKELSSLTATGGGSNNRVNLSWSESYDEGGNLISPEGNEIIPNSAIIARWSFDEGASDSTTLFDSSGNSHHATFSDDLPITYHVVGMKGGALDFSGTKYATVGTSTDFDNLAQISVEAWVNLDSVTRWHPIVTKRSYCVSDPGNYEAWSLTGNNTDDSLTFHIRTASNTVSTVSTATDSLDQYIGKWVHLIGTYDGTKTRIYVNGELAATGNTVSGAIHSYPTIPVFIGGRAVDGCPGTTAYTGTDSITDGRIDEAAVYNTALTAEQIRAKYISDSLLAYYKMDEASGAVAYDSSSPLNNGTVTNTTTRTTCKLGNCIDFDGVNDYVDLGASLAEGETALTVSAWVNPDDPWAVGSNGQNILRKWEPEGHTILLTLYEEGLWFGINDTEDRDIVGQVSFPDATYQNKWTHVLGTWDMATDSFKIYVNGVSQTISYTQDTPLLTGLLASNVNLEIGRWYWAGASQYFDGQIDEFTINNSYFSAQQVKRLYNKGLTHFILNRSTTEDGPYTPVGGIFDDFSTDTLSDYTKTGSWAWSSANSGFVSDTGGNIFEEMMHNTIPSSNDYIVEAKMKNGDTSQIGVTFRDDGGGYTCQIVDVDSVVRLSKGGTGGLTTTLAEATRAISTNHYYLIKAKVVGDHIQCYVDDILYIEYYDSTYTSGAVGFISNNNEPDASVDYFKVTPLYPETSLLLYDEDATDNAAPNQVTGLAKGADTSTQCILSWSAPSDNPTTYYYTIDAVDSIGNYSFDQFRADDSYGFETVVDYTANMDTHFVFRNWNRDGFTSPVYWQSLNWYTGSLNSYAYWIVMEDNYVIQSGDYLQYDIYIDSSLDTTDPLGFYIDMDATDSTHFRYSYVQRIETMDEWVPIAINLSALAGKTVNQLHVVYDDSSNGAGANFAQYALFDNLRIGPLKSVANTSGVQQYYIDQSPNGGSGGDAYTGTTSTSKTVTGLTNGTEYTFKVLARDYGANNGAYSTTVTCTPINTSPIIDTGSWSISPNNPIQNQILSLGVDITDSDTTLTTDMVYCEFKDPDDANWRPCLNSTSSTLTKSTNTFTATLYSSCPENNNSCNANATLLSWDNNSAWLPGTYTIRFTVNDGDGHTDQEQTTFTLGPLDVTYDFTYGSGFTTASISNKKAGDTFNVGAMTLANSGLATTQPITMRLNMKAMEPIEWNDIDNSNDLQQNGGAISIRRDYWGAWNYASGGYSNRYIYYFISLGDSLDGAHTYKWRITKPSGTIWNGSTPYIYNAGAALGEAEDSCTTGTDAAGLAYVECTGTYGQSSVTEYDRFGMYLRSDSYDLNNYYANFQFEIDGGATDPNLYLSGTSGDMSLYEADKLDINEADFNLSAGGMELGNNGSPDCYVQTASNEVGSTLAMSCLMSLNEQIEPWSTFAIYPYGYTYPDSVRADASIVVWYYLDADDSLYPALWASTIDTDATGIGWKYIYVCTDGSASGIPCAEAVHACMDSCTDTDNGVFKAFSHGSYNTYDQDDDGDTDYCLSGGWQDCYNNADCQAGYSCNNSSNTCELSTVYLTITADYNADYPLNSSLGGVNLRWNNISDESGFMLYRSTDNSTFSILAYPSINVLSYTDTDLTDNSTYYYKIVASVGAQTFESNVVSTVTADRNASSLPTLTVSHSGSNNYLDASWTVPNDVSNEWPYSTTINPSNIIGHWRFEEGAESTAYDLSGNDNDGTITGAVWSTSGKIGNALDFDGGGTNIVDIPADTKFDFTGDYTLEAWIKPDNVAKLQGIMGKNSGNGWGLNLNSTGKANFGMHGCSNFDGSTSLQTGQWYHVVGVFSTSVDDEIYINGENDTPNSNNLTAGNCSSNTSAVVIGRYRAETAYDFDGLIDEVTIYNTALTPDQIRAKYMRDSMVGYWRFEEGTGTLAMNSSATDNNGTITGATWATGKMGNALNFNGSSDYVTILDNSSLDLTDKVTLSAWVYANSFPNSYPRVLNKKDSYGMYFDSSGNLQFRLMTTGINSNYAVSTGSWQHLAITFDDVTDAIVFYVNGKEVNSTSSSVDLTANNNSLTLGNYSGATRYFNGKIDEPMIFNSALSATDVNKLYNAGVIKYNLARSTTQNGTYSIVDANSTSTSYQDTGATDSAAPAQMSAPAITASTINSCSMTYSAPSDSGTTYYFNLTGIDDKGNQTVGFTNPGFEAMDAGNAAAAFNWGAQDSSCGAPNDNDSCYYRIENSNSISGASWYAQGTSLTGWKQVLFQRVSEVDVPSATFLLEFDYSCPTGTSSGWMMRFRDAAHACCVDSFTNAGIAYKSDETTAVKSMDNFACTTGEKGHFVGYITMASQTDPQNWFRVWERNENVGIQELVFDNFKVTHSSSATTTTGLAATPYTITGTGGGSDAASPYTASSLTSNTSYTYTVKATDGGSNTGTDSTSSSACITLPATPSVSTVAGSACGSTINDATPTVAGSAIGGSASHTHSDWAICTNSTPPTTTDDYTCTGGIYSRNDTTNKTTWTSTSLSDTSYYAFVRYNNTSGSTGGDSAWSSGCTFTVSTDSDPPTQSNWSPAKSATITSTSQIITFTTNENADCKWSLTDQAYGDMSGDCTGDGGTSQSCSVSGMQAGAEIVYTACRDTVPNADTIETNEHIDYSIILAVTLTADYNTSYPLNSDLGATILRWNDSPSETGYKVLRSTDNSSYSQVGSNLAANTVIYNDLDLISNTTYYYKVATIIEGTDYESNIVSTIIPDRNAPVPPALTVSHTGSNNYLDASWTVPNDISSEWPYSTTINPSNVVGHWKFEEGTGTTIGDLSGNANTGTITGADWNSSGKIGNALSFNGSSDVITVPHNTGLNPGAFTISFWAKPDTMGDWKRWMSKSTSLDAPAGRGWRIMRSNTDAATLSLYDAAGVAKYSTGVSYKLNKWAKFTFTYSTPYIKSYKNDELIGTIDVGSWTFEPSTESFKIGKGYWESYFNGSLDEVIFYNTALTPEQIRAKFMQDSMVGYWRFEEGTGTNASDSSLNGNNGTLYNTPTWATNSKIGKGINFTGTDAASEYIEISNSASLQEVTDSSFTFSAWAKPDAVALSADPYNTNASIICRNGWNTQTSYRPNQKFRMNIWANGGGTTYIADSVGTFAPGSWHHVVGVADDLEKKVKIYVDGKFENETDYVGALRDYGTTVYRIGACKVSSAQYENWFDGEIDEPMIFNSALSPTDVNKLYNAGVVKYGLSRSSTETGTYTPVGGLFDDFSDNDYTSNPTWTCDSGVCTVSSGILNLMPSSGGTVASITPANMGLFNDFTWEATVIPKDATLGQNEIANFLFRRQTTNSDHYQLTIQQSNITIQKRFNATWSIIQQTPYTFNIDTKYKIKLVVKGNNYKAYVNDVLFIDIDDSDMPEEQVVKHIYIYDNIADIPHTQLDDIKIIPLLTETTYTDTGATDSTAPSTPASLTVTSTTTDTINFSWSASTDTGTIYYYYLDAIDDAGNKSNLVGSNSGFEKDSDADGRADNWGSYYNGDSSTTYQIVPGYTGNNAQQFTFTYGTGPCGGITRSFVATANTTYKIDVFCRHISGDNLRSWRDNGSSATTVFSCGSDWTQQSVTFTSTNAGIVNYYLHSCYQNSVNQIDNVRISQVPSATVTTGLKQYMLDYVTNDSFTTIVSSGSTTGSVSGLSDGTQYCFTIHATDNADNNSSASSQVCGTTLSSSITLSSATHPTEGTWYNDSTPDMVTSGSFDHVKYYVSTNATETSTTIKASGTTDATGTFTPTLASSNTWYVHVVGLNELEEGTATDHYMVKYDGTNPTATSLAVSSWSGGVTDYTNDTTPPFTISASDSGGSSLNQMSFSCNNSTWSSWVSYATSYSSFNVRTGAGCTDAEGSKTIYVKFNDGAGNTSTSVNTGAFTLDTTAPTSNSISLHSSAWTGGVTNYTNDDTPQLTIASTGAYQIKFSCNSSLWDTYRSYATSVTNFDVNSGSYGCTASDGSKTIYITFIDQAGNTATTNATAFTLDHIAPVPSPSTPANGFRYSSPDPSLTATNVEATAGLQKCWARIGTGNPPSSPTRQVSGSIEGTTCTFSGYSTLSEGTYYWDVNAMDKAGNWGAYSSTYSIVRDNTAPSIPTAFTIENDSTAPYWDNVNNSATPLTFTALESSEVCKWNTTSTTFASMVNSCTVNGTGISCAFGNLGQTTTSSQYNTRYHACTDDVNNAYAQQGINFGIDWTAPTTSDNSNTTIQVPNYIVTLTEADNASNVGSNITTVYCKGTSCTPTTSIDTGETVTYTSSDRGVTALRYYSTDLAGNSQTLVNKVININRLPVFTSASDDAGTVKGGTDTVTITTSTSDADSGQATRLYVCKGNSTPSSSGCGADGQYCTVTNANDVDNPSCNWTAESDDTSHTWYAYIFDSLNESAADNPRTGSYTTDSTAPTITPTTPANASSSSDNTPSLVGTSNETLTDCNVQIATDEGFTSIVNGFNGVDGNVSGTSCTYDVNVASALSDGTYYWRIGGIDSVGNIGTYDGNYSLIIDTTAVSTSVVSVAGDTTAPYWDTTNDSQTAVVVSGEAEMKCRWDTDDKVYDDLNAGAYECSINGTQATCNLGAIDQAATNYRYISCEDSVGNDQLVGQNINLTFGVDWTAPNICTTAITTATTATYAISPANIETSAMADNITLNTGTCEYTLNGSTWTTGNWSSANTKCMNNSVALNTGSNAIAYRMNDTAGNTRTCSNITRTKDVTAPTVGVTSIAGDISSPYLDESDNNSTLMVLSVGDTASGVADGIATCKWSTTNVAYSAMSGSCSTISNGASNCEFGNLSAGNYTRFYSCADAVGNPSDTNSVTFTNTYNTPPVLGGITLSKQYAKQGDTIMATGTGVSDGQTDNLAIYCSLTNSPGTETTDFCSKTGIDNYSYTHCSGSGSSGDGATTVYCVLYDGIEYSTVKSAIYTKDNTAPANVDFTFGTIGTTNISLARITTAPTDAGSGLAPIPYNFQQIGGASNDWQTETTWDNTSLDVNTPYSYKLTVRDAVGNSADSSVKQKFTRALTPSLSSITCGVDNCSIGFSMGTNPSATQYLILRTGDNVSSEWRTVSSPYLDTGLTAGSTYCYRIKARNGDLLETPYNPSTSVDPMCGNTNSLFVQTSVADVNGFFDTTDNTLWIPQWTSADVNAHLVCSGGTGQSSAKGYSTYPHNGISSWQDGVADSNVTYDSGILYSGGFFALKPISITGNINLIIEGPTENTEWLQYSTWIEPFTFSPNYLGVFVRNRTATTREGLSSAVWSSFKPPSYKLTDINGTWIEYNIKLFRNTTITTTTDVIYVKGFFADYLGAEVEQNTACDKTYYRVDTNPLALETYATGTYTAFGRTWKELTPDNNVFFNADGNYALEFFSKSITGWEEPPRKINVLLQKFPDDISLQDICTGIQDSLTFSANWDASSTLEGVYKYRLFSSTSKAFEERTLVYESGTGTNYAFNLIDMDMKTCGDGRCSYEENCPADSIGCLPGEMCSNGCELQTALTFNFDSETCQPGMNNKPLDEWCQTQFGVAYACIDGCVPTEDNQFSTTTWDTTTTNDTYNYCGDGYCDASEFCPKDNPFCGDGSACITGCVQQTYTCGDNLCGEFENCSTDNGACGSGYACIDGCVPTEVFIGVVNFIPSYQFEIENSIEAGQGRCGDGFCETYTDRLDDDGNPFNNVDMNAGFDEYCPLDNRYCLERTGIEGAICAGGCIRPTDLGTQFTTLQCGDGYCAIGENCPIDSGDCRTGEACISGCLPASGDVINYPELERFDPHKGSYDGDIWFQLELESITGSRTLSPKISCEVDYESPFRIPNEGRYLNKNIREGWGDVNFTFPLGTFAGDNNVVIDANITAPTFTRGRMLQAYNFELPTGNYAFGEDRPRLSLDINILALSCYDDSNITAPWYGCNEGDLRKVSIYDFNESTGDWQKTPSVVDVDNLIVYADLNHFSTYGLGEDTDSPTVTLNDPENELETSDTALDFSGTPDEAITNCYLQVDNDEAFTSPVSGLNEVDVGIDCAYNGSEYSELSEGDTYYWRMKATDEAENEGEYSSAFNFTIPSTDPCNNNGSCEAGETEANCPADCASAGCTATTCSALGYECGSASDGCGETLNCGSCSSGYECTSGTCTEIDTSTEEVCDGIDNDGDTLIDEDLERACGTCGTQSCSGGIWESCNEPPICGGTDLKISAYSSPSQAEYDQSTNVSLNIQNNGQTTETSFIIQNSENGGSYFDTKTINGLEAGDATGIVFTIPWSQSYTGTTKTFTLEADYGNAVEETDETNNIESFSMEFGREEICNNLVDDDFDGTVDEDCGVPNLRITNIDLGTPHYVGSELVQIDFNVTIITEFEDVDTEFVVSYFKDALETDKRITLELIDSLSVGDELKLMFVYSAPIGEVFRFSGKETIPKKALFADLTNFYVEVDSSNNIDEGTTGENDNVVTINIQNLVPDLTISNYSIPSSSFLNTTVDLNVTLSNVGESEAEENGYSVTVYVEDIANSTVSGPALASGEEADLSFILIGITQGIHLISVKVDSLEELTESSEENNEIESPHEVISINTEIYTYDSFVDREPFIVGTWNSEAEPNLFEFEVSTINNITDTLLELTGLSPGNVFEIHFLEGTKNIDNYTLNSFMNNENISQDALEVVDSTPENVIELVNDLTVDWALDSRFLKLMHYERINQLSYVWWQLYGER